MYWILNLLLKVFYFLIWRNNPFCLSLSFGELWTILSLTFEGSTKSVYWRLLLIVNSLTFENIIGIISFPFMMLGKSPNSMGVNMEFDVDLI